ncbi:DNA mismatch repair protein MutS, partial [Trichinella spiralis]
DDGKKKHGRNCELKSAAAFDPFSVCNVIDALQYGSITFWVTGIDTSNGQCKFQQQSDIIQNIVQRILRRKRCPPIRSYRCFWCCCHFPLDTLPVFCSSYVSIFAIHFSTESTGGMDIPSLSSAMVNFKIFSKSFESVPASDELTNGWKSLLSSMLPKILPEKTADMVRTVVDMVKLVNTSQPTSNEEHFNEAAAVTKSITVDETIIRVPARSPSVMEQSLGLLRPFFGSIDPWRAILYRDPPLLSVDLADGDSQENDMTRSTLSLDSFKSNFFKSTNHDSQLLDELETEPVAAKRPVDYFNYYYNS